MHTSKCTCMSRRMRYFAIATIVGISSFPAVVCGQRIVGSEYVQVLERVHSYKRLARCFLHVLC
jgi:hypothetical protein